MSKTTKIIYWSSTILLSALLITSAGMYVFNNVVVSEMFKTFGYPTYIIYPLAIAKVAAVIVLLSQKQSNIKEWAYAALFFEFILAFFAHFMIGDGEQMGAVMAIALLLISYFFGKKIFISKTI
ncbi:DoxX-like family protein [Lutibacter agarilyticus]|uniref:DoxX-like family protein n=1 Tax=Lutibacter agarilyticus TaxID=1109740 RepID=A0A238X0K3_9FLAO|nr:DoxX family protein [Lutibacter agarilyticus]SNR52396.1 DoxX-like family protein [Lutibacter agarilyticus]